MDSLVNQRNPKSDDEACVYSIQLALLPGLTLALRASIDLGLLEIMAKAGPAAQLSASEIVSLLSTQNPDATAMLERILRLLASFSILTCSVVTQDDGTQQRFYGLAPVCKYLVRNEDGVSISPLFLLINDKVFADSWYALKDAILEGGVPFDKVHGMNAFEYPGTDPRFNKVFNEAMYNHSTVIMKKILETYKGFEELKELVDVGGGVGATLNLITSKYPHIEGINFDLPHVLADAPAYQGVDHVGGDMFLSVPRSEAIFMKWILHDWSDEKCLILLKNCYAALPESGKLVVVESVVPATLETNVAATSTFLLDLLMLTYNPGGKERTQKDYEQLVNEADFSGTKVICCVCGFTVMEVYKQ